MPKWVVEMGQEEAPSGPPVIEQTSDPTSEPSEAKTWTAQLGDGSMVKVKVSGGRGRISYGGDPRTGGRDVRFYRNESTKTYEGVLSNVVNIFSDAVEVAIEGRGMDPATAEDARKTMIESRDAWREAKKTLNRMEEKLKSAATKPWRPSWKSLSDEQQEPWFLKHGSFAEAEAAYERGEEL